MYYVGRHSTQNSIDIDQYLGSGTWITRSVNKYGKSKFKREIISYYPTEDELKIAEELLIAEHLGKPGCMNFSPHSAGGWRYVNEIVLPAMKTNGTYQPPIMSGSKNGMFGKTHTNTTKAALSIKMKNKYSTPEWKQLHKELQTGRIKSVEERVKQSHNVRNAVFTEERKSNLSLALQGKPSGSSGKKRMRSEKYQVNIGLPKEHVEYFSKWLVLGKNKQLLDSLGALPFDMKNIIMHHDDLNFTKRVRSLREALALLETGMKPKCNHVLIELVKIQANLNL